MRPVTLPLVLQASAVVRPDRVAIRDAAGTWTYRQVWSAVRTLSARLRGQGLGTGDLVGLVAGRRAGAPVAMAAVMAAGAAYVPIDPSWPLARQRTLVDACHPVLIVSVDADPPPAGRWDTLRLHTADLLGHDRCGEDDKSIATDGDALAYVIFTSGSTGQPKGVMVTSRSAANLVSSVADLVRLDERSRMIALSSFSFDISVFEIFGTWCGGAELVVADQEQLNPHRLAELLTGTRRAYLQTTPSVLAALLDAGLAVPEHTVLLLAGERLPRALVQRVAHVRQVWNLYGPTEATIYASAHACLPLPDDTDADPPIGRPVAGTVLEVRGAGTDPGGVGAPGRAPRDGRPGEGGRMTDPGPGGGELMIGGPGVARGYLGQPELTAQAFLAGPAGRWYRTGDIVERNADGTWAFLGRADRQVKIRGNRVELDEIEAVIARLLGHTKLSVEAVDGGRLGTQVAAFVQAASGDDLTDLRGRIAEVLPAYMVPTRIHQIERLPMTSSGKIDRRALADPGSEEINTRAVQGWLVGAWGDLFGADVTPQSNFYALGGQSLLAMRVAAAVEGRYGLVIGTNTVLRNPVLSDLAREIAVRLTP